MPSTICLSWAKDAKTKDVCKNRRKSNLPSRQPSETHQTQPHQTMSGKNHPQKKHCINWAIKVSIDPAEQRSLRQHENLVRLRHNETCDRTPKHYKHWQNKLLASDIDKASPSEPENRPLSNKKPKWTPQNTCDKDTFPPPPKKKKKPGVTTEDRNTATQTS